MLEGAYSSEDGLSAPIEKDSHKIQFFDEATSYGPLKGPLNSHLSVLLPGTIQC